jgi:hypothetical protein
VLELWPRYPVRGSGGHHPPGGGGGQYPAGVGSGGHVEVYPAVGDPPHDIMVVGPV